MFVTHPRSSVFQRFPCILHISPLCFWCCTAQLQSYEQVWASLTVRSGRRRGLTVHTANAKFRPWCTNPETKVEDRKWWMRWKLNVKLLAVNSCFAVPIGFATSFLDSRCHMMSHGFSMVFAQGWGESWQLMVAGGTEAGYAAFQRAPDLVAACVEDLEELRAEPRKKPFIVLKDVAWLKTILDQILDHLE